MKEAGVTTQKEREEFIERAEAQLKEEMKVVEEVIDEEKEQALAAVADLINALEKLLIEEGIEDEVARWQIIMKKLEEEEERLLANNGEIGDEEDCINCTNPTVKEEL